MTKTYKKLPSSLPVNDCLELPFPSLTKRYQEGLEIGYTFVKYTPKWWAKARRLVGRKYGVDDWRGWVLLRHKATRTLVWVEFYHFETWWSLVQRWKDGDVVWKNYFRGEVNVKRLSA